MTELFGRLGLEHSMNAYADHGATSLVYSMFDIKYILSNKELTDTTTLELVGTADDEYLYHAKYTLPLGYMVSSTIMMTGITKTAILSRYKMILYRRIQALALSLQQ